MQFWSVTRLDPSTFDCTTYWSYGLTSTTDPVLSHFFGREPIWFCNLIRSNRERGQASYVLFQTFSDLHVTMAKCVHAGLEMFCYVGCGRYLSGRIGMKSLMGWPKRHIAGESLVSWLGVLRYCNIAWLNASVSSSPFGPELSMCIHLTVLTLLA